MTEKPSRNEEEYFARREAELKEARREATHTAASDAERKQHYMKCPKCGADLQVEDHHGVEIDRCPECHGVWFDEGEAELLSEKESAGIKNILSAVVRAIGGSKKKSVE